MKKIIGLSGLLLAVGLVTGCGEEESQIIEKVVVPSETEVASEVADDYEKYRITKPEFNSILDMMEDFERHFAPNSEYKSFQSELDAERQLAYATVRYIVYFKDEIKELGMTEEFDELLETAIAVDSNFEYEKFQELTDVFEAKFHEVNSML